MNRVRLAGTLLATKITYGSGHVSTGDTLNGRVEVVKGLALDDLSADLTANTEHGEATFNNDQSKPPNKQVRSCFACG